MRRHSALWGLGAVAFMLGCTCSSCDTQNHSDSGDYTLRAPGTEILGVGPTLEIGVGMERLVRVHGASGDAQAPKALSKAGSEPASLIDVSLTGEDLRVTGKAPGSGKLTVTTASGDQDSFDLRVHEVGGLKLGACRQGAVYLRGTRGAVVAMATKKSGGELRGSFVKPPVEISPKGAARLSQGDVAWFLSFVSIDIAGSAPELLTLSSQTYEAEQAHLVVHDPSTLEDIDLDDPGHMGLHVGDTSTFGAALQTKHGPACVHLEVEFVSMTPKTCKIRASGSKGDYQASFKTTLQTPTSKGKDAGEVIFLGTDTCTIVGRTKVGSVSLQSSTRGRLRLRASRTRANTSVRF